MGCYGRAPQEENLAALVRNQDFQFTKTFFPYASGQIGPYYAQSTVIEMIHSKDKQVI